MSCYGTRRKQMSQFDLPVPDARKQLDFMPQMCCRIKPNLGNEDECGKATDYVLHIGKIKGIFTDIPVCAEHAGLAKSAARLLFGSAKLAQWQAVKVTQYQALVVSLPEEKDEGRSDDER